MSHIRRLSAGIAMLLLVSAAPASAGLFGKKDKPVESETVAAAKDPSATQLPTVLADPGFTPASAAEIQAALRADPLAQSAFFSNQYEHNPTDANMGLYLSNALRALGRYAEAADAAHRVLLFAPNNQPVLIAAARAHIADNNAFFAIDLLQQAITLKPNDWMAYSLLGVAYDQTKRPDEAQATWAKALQVAPSNPFVLTNMAMSKVTRGDFSGAEPLLRTAVAQPTATTQMRQNLALVLGMQNKMAEAEHLLRRDLPPQQADASLAWLQQAVNPHVSSVAPAANTPQAVRSWNSVMASGS